MELQGVIDFEKRGGLVTAIAQDHRTGEVLMVAYMNEQALRRTLETGHAVYWSTSRERLWPKGEESGNVQIVKAVRADCDGDAVLLSVEQVGEAACHTGRRSCFYRRREGEGWVEEGEPLFDPAEVYRK